MMAHGIAPMLIAAAAGYWVVTQAEHQKGSMRKLGQYLGVAIIVISVAAASVKVYAAAVRCGMMGGKGFCPISSKTPPEHGGQQAVR